MSNRDKFPVGSRVTFKICVGSTHVGTDHEIPQHWETRHGEVYGHTRNLSGHVVAQVRCDTDASGFRTIPFVALTSEK